MSIRSAQSITAVFTTRNALSGVGVNADSLPTGTLYVNGTADAASVTVTNITTGVYKAAVTLPTLAVGDVADLRINATVGAVADNGVVWRDTKDFVIDAAGLVDANTVKVGPTGSGTAQTAGDIPARLPLALTANGNIKASLLEILTTALTETSGLLAGGFKIFFNVTAPTGTLNSLPDAVPDASGGLPVTGNRLTAIPVVAHVTLVDTTTTVTGGATATALATVQSDTDDIQTRLPAALVGGRMDSSVGAVAAGVIAASAFAANALDAVWSTATRVLTAATNLTTALATPTNITAGTITTVGSVTGLTASDVGAIKLKTDNLPSDPADASDIAALFAAIASTLAGLSIPTAAQNRAEMDSNSTKLAAIATLFTTALTESYNVDGAAPTPAQALFVIMQRLTEFAISGTTITAKKLDGSTTAFTLTIDDATAPTSSTRAT